MEEWQIYVTEEFRAWFQLLDHRSRKQITDSIDRLAESGPALGRPMVDRITGSSLHNLKELRPGSTGRSEIRILFLFDPWRAAILLVGGDKSGAWSDWYRVAVPAAEKLYQRYLQDRQNEADREEGN